jgi:putative ABC transport system permease protein
VRASRVGSDQPLCRLGRAVAVFGTAGGLGLLLGWAVGRAASDGAFAAPVAQSAVIAVVGALAGVIAAVRPARGAARLDILDAIATT